MIESRGLPQSTSSVLQPKMQTRLADLESIMHPVRLIGWGWQIVRSKEEDEGAAAIAGQRRRGDCGQSRVTAAGNAKGTSTGAPRAAHCPYGPPDNP